MEESSEQSFRWGESEVADPPALDDVFACLRQQRRHDPRSLRLEVRRFLLRNETDGDRPAHGDDYWFTSIIVQMVPTSIRVTYTEEFEVPEYEAEGWLLGDYVQKIWVRLSLRTAPEGAESGDSVTITEAAISCLPSGSELGTASPPTIN